MKKVWLRRRARIHRWATSTLPRRGLVPRLPRPRGHHDGAVVGGEVLVGPVDARLVAAGTRDRALELVGDPQRGRAPEVLDHPDVGSDPVGQLLGLGRLGVGEAAGAEHGDEQLDAPRFARPGSTTVGRLPEKSMNVFSPARCTCRIDGRSRRAHCR